MGAQSFAPAAGAQFSYRPRPENLALTYQELLTVAVRVRSGRQAVNDAESFRAHIRSALKKAEQTSLQKGYNAQDIRMASFAVVALLDESILNSRNPAFADWARKPLQEELFGGHVAGEIFFQGLDRILSLKDSAELADLLEVYGLCLLLGYRGRYGIGNAEALRGYKDAIAEKIRRIRGPERQFAQPWAGAINEAPVKTEDRWTRRLAFAAIGCLVLAVVLFVVFSLSLG
ncbi:MAG: DotU family type IV/VI secretion system protein [Acidobacteriota bacterium]|nr:DotU family type IV/VI secretion system protein [Acidobacteriota bacterium]